MIDNLGLSAKAKRIKELEARGHHVGGGKEQENNLVAK
jgi:hypothetical protein